MSLTAKALDLIKRFGAPAKFAAKIVLSAVVPGSPAVIELVEKVLDSAHETVKDNLSTLADPADLQRVEQMLDLLNGTLQPLMGRLSRLERMPDVARQTLEAALATDETCRRGARRLEELAGEIQHTVQQTHVKVGAIHAEQQRQRLQLEDIYAAVYQLLGTRKSATPAALPRDDFSFSLPMTLVPGKYDALITSKNPTCLLLLVDQSQSMQRPFGRQPALRKADGVAVMINSILDSLCLQCGNAPKLYVGVIGYGSAVGPILEGPLAKRPLVSTEELAGNKLEVLTISVVKKVASGKQVKKPKKVSIWIRSRADGSTTPMMEALQLARTIVADFLAQHPDCFPPIILNFTDGEPRPGDPAEAAAALRQLASTNGNLLLFNAHLSDQPQDPVLFPRDESLLPSQDGYARRMFAMSSVLPDLLVHRAQVQKYHVVSGARCFAFNGDLDAVSKVLEVGTSTYVGRIEDLLPAVRPGNGKG
jgi:hypothetical protein